MFIGYKLFIVPRILKLYLISISPQVVACLFVDGKVFRTFNRDGDQYIVEECENEYWGFR